MRAVRGAAVCALVACSASVGCSVETGAIDKASRGSLALAWTIDRVKDPKKCVQLAAAAMKVTITDDVGGFVGSYEAACASFRLDIELPAGAYRGAARLVDSDGNDRTKSVDIPPFELGRAGSVDVPIDVPTTPNT